ncbi:BA75_00483T0 [Komagataella pastoris]|uniref:BA75_00483T0 n=1 Tax=Komagataella pastoris TaxID=4922 RepID=A0A1B2J6G6_PICPA|nr:BA75_00483T0 [Komagataella pastoris]
MARHPWKKLLWLKQDYADNYTDSSFLSQLKKNTTVANYSYVKLVNDFALIVLHSSTIVLVSIVFYGVYHESWNPVIPTLVSTLITFIFWVVYMIISYMNNLEVASVVGTLKSSLLILFILLALSPVLKSLTDSTSSDSIWALSCWICVVNVLFNDYVIEFSGATHTSNLSKNLALSNAILLASRLYSNLAAFSFILFCIQVQGLFPMFNNFTRRCQMLAFHRFQLVAIVGGVNYLVYSILGTSALSCWIALQGIILFIGPSYFIRLQKYKEELQGPWDPVKPRISVS